MKSIHVLRKPCSEPIVAANVLRWGTGALNVDSCRVGVDTDRAARYGGRAPKGGGNIAFAGDRPEPWVVLPGRWPANLVLDAIVELGGVFPDTKDGVANPKKQGGSWHSQAIGGSSHPGFGGSGSASRFFKHVGGRSE